MSETELKQLIFIYNADSGFINGVKDFFHKIFQKSTYECNLCAVTYGNFGMKKEWKSFVKGLPCNFIEKKKDAFSFVFLHKDEFINNYNVTDAKFPSAYIKTPSRLELFISEEEMNSINSINELKTLVNKKIIEHSQ